MLGENKNKEVELRSSSNKATLVGIFFILIAVAGFTFFTKGLAADVSSYKVDLSSKIEKSSALEAEVEDLAEKQEVLDVSTTVNRRKSLDAIPTDLNQDEVIRNIVRIAEDNLIDFNSISFSQGGTQKEGVSALRVSASFEGDYGDLINFLEGIEQNARMINVNTISVQVSDVDIGSIKRVTFALSMEAYYQDNN